MISELWIRFPHLGVVRQRKRTKTHQRPFLSHLEASRRHALFPFAFIPSSINFAIASWRLRPFCVAHAVISAARDSRAHHGQSKIKSRLCAVEGLDPEEWDLPPKPKWMRWQTYERYETRFDRYEEMLDLGFLELVRKLGLK